MKIISIFILLLSTSIYSQAKVRIVVISTPKTKITVEVDNQHKKIKPKNNKTYYWLKAKNIISTQGGYQESLLHGNYSENYSNHQLKILGTFKYGLKHKTWKYWDKNGQLQKIETWVNGELKHVQSFNKENKEKTSKPIKKKKLDKKNKQTKKDKKAVKKEDEKTTNNQQNNKK